MEHKQTELTAITKAKDWCSYMMTVTQKSPKQFRFTFTSILQNLSFNVIESLYRANDTLVTKLNSNVFLYPICTPIHLGKLIFIVSNGQNLSCWLFRENGGNCLYLGKNWVSKGTPHNPEVVGSNPSPATISSHKADFSVDVIQKSGLFSP